MNADPNNTPQSNVPEPSSGFEPAKKKKSLISIPFILLGLLLVALMVPVLEDFDNPIENKRDSVGKWLMFKVFSSQEDSKAQSEAIKGKAAGKMGQGIEEPPEMEFKGAPNGAPPKRPVLDEDE